MRVQGWEKILAEMVERARHGQFSRGHFDCCMWPADVVLAMTGIDGAADYRGYRSLAGGLRMLAKLAHGSLIEAMQKAAVKHGWAQISPLFAQRGDIGVVDNHNEGLSLTVCIGPMFVTPSLDGGLVSYHLAEVLYAWRIS